MLRYPGLFGLQVIETHFRQFEEEEDCIGCSHILEVYR